MPNGKALAGDTEPTKAHSTVLLCVKLAEIMNKYNNRNNQR